MLLRLLFGVVAWGVADTAGCCGDAAVVCCVDVVTVADVARVIGCGVWGASAYGVMCGVVGVDKVVVSRYCGVVGGVGGGIGVGVGGVADVVCIGVGVVGVGCWCWCVCRCG